MGRLFLRSARLRSTLAWALRRGRAGARPLLGLLVVWSLLASPLQVLLNARGATGTAPALAHSAFDVPANTPTPTPTATATATPTGTATPPSLPPPPPTNTIGLPTAVPTGTPIPDTDVVDQEIAAEQAGILADVAALPVLTGTITGTLVSTLTGGQVSSADGGLTLGLLPNLLPLTSTLDVQVLTATFPVNDPRATRDGYPLAYMYSLSATDVLTGAPVTHFARDVDLLFNIDPAVLAAAGVHGASLHIYTFDEQLGDWQEIPSYWNVATHQLIATTPHFSLYAVGDGFDVVNNYLPSINDFETNLQTGSASVQYPLNLPPGPGGFGPQLSLSYNSGSVDRVDNGQQGDSAVGWGWTLSMNYIAATQHHFVRSTPTPPPSPSPTPTPDTYDPWTASIVVNGINGDLVQGTPLALSTGTPQPVWHTANESFVKVIYHPGTVDSPRTTDWWEAWDKSGTHYVFDIQVLTHDNAWGQGGLTTYRWMLDTATDTHQNVIHYRYRYEPDCCAPATTPMPTTPPTTGGVRAVYPDQITYGDTSDGQGDKVRVVFTLTPRPIGGQSDYGTPAPDIYQGWRVTGLTIERQQATPTTSPEPSPTYAPLRTYEFIQSYKISLPAPTETPTVSCTGTATPTPMTYPHLTLDGIKEIGNDNSSYLPETTFTYWNPCMSAGDRDDWGHLFSAANGYGGLVDFYYDAAGTDVSHLYRRVRAKVVQDGLGGIDASPPHKVKYFYTYRGAQTNTKNISDIAAAATGTPVHASGSEFRGFAFVEEQDPLGNTTDHYYSQDDVQKALEWRSQVGKAPVYTETMDLDPTATAHPDWSFSGTVDGADDPSPSPTDTSTTTPTPNRVWELSTATAAIVRTTPVGDGADISIRFLVNLTTHGGTPVPTFAATYQLENAAADGEYWALHLESFLPPDDPSPRLRATLAWDAKDAGATHHTGSRQLTFESGVALKRPYLGEPLILNKWYRLYLHTSPDGRFALELQTDNAKGSGYIQVKSGDLWASGTIPEFLPRQSWVFRHEVTADSGGDYHSYVDFYTEGATLYSQADSLYGPTAIPTATYVADYHVGNNNCDGMVINFVPVIESRTTLYGPLPATLSTTAQYIRRSKMTYDYDSYGNQKTKIEWGDLDVATLTPNPQRNTRTTYASVNTADTYIVDHPLEVDTYDGTTTATVVAKVRYYYDYNTGTPTPIGTRVPGDLTKLEQVSAQVSPTQTPVAQQFVYDSYGNRTHVSDPDGNDTQTKYDDYYHAFPAEIDYPNGGKVQMSYDFTLDQVSEQTDMHGTNTPTTTHHRYDALGRPDHSWIDGFGSDGQPNERYVFPPLNQTTVTVPFAISYVRLEVSPTASATAVTNWQQRWFDGRGRTLQDVSLQASGTVIAVDTTYTDTGQIASVTLPYTVANPNPSPTASPTVMIGTLSAHPVMRTYYDGIYRTTMQINPDGTYVLNDYSTLQWVSMLNETGRKISRQHTDWLGRQDATSEETTDSSAALMKTAYTFDALDHVKTVVRDYGETDALTTMSMTYDGFGRKTQMVDADMGTWTYAYDKAGNLTEQQDALYHSDSTTYADHDVFLIYNSMNQLKAKYYGAAHYSATPDPTPDVIYYYDDDLHDASTAHSWGRVRAAEVTAAHGADQANRHDYYYDARGQLLSDVLTVASTWTTRTPTVGYTYDAGGRLDTLTYPVPESTPEVVTVSYNAQGAGLPYKVSSSLGGALPVYYATYNSRGQLATLQQGSSSVDMNLLTTTYTYDDATTKRGWLTHSVSTAPRTGGTNTYLDLSFTYDDTGNLLTTTGSANVGGTPDGPAFTNTYTYDGLDRLSTAQSRVTASPTPPPLFPDQTDTFDQFGRLQTRTLGGTTNDFHYSASGHFDAPSSYDEVPSDYTYDANGNQITRSEGSTTQTRTFDPENRLVQVYQTDASTTSVTSSYIYDANGQRVISSVTTSSGIDVSTTSTLYVGNLYEEQLAAVDDPAYTVYYYLGDKRVALRRANWEDGARNGQYRLLGDQVGSTTVLLDTASPPAVLQRQYYDPYGQAAYSTGSEGTSYGFTGQRLDESTALMYYGARYYDPVLSYFISPDGIAPDKGKPQSGDRYSYVLNNPLRYKDPTGKCAEDDPHKCKDATTTSYNNAVEADKAELLALGIDVVDTCEDGCLTFTLRDLDEILAGLHRLMDTAGWTPAEFRASLGIDRDHRIQLRMMSGADIAKWAPDHCGPAAPGCTKNLTIALNREQFDINHDPKLGEAGRLSNEATFVHELAHAWDNRFGNKFSTGMYNAATYYDDVLHVRRSIPGETTVGTYGETNQYEDWATTVEAMVFYDTPLRDHYPFYLTAQARVDYVEDVFHYKTW